jgi:hypothetical protein
VPGLFRASKGIPAISATVIVKINQQKALRRLKSDTIFWGIKKMCLLLFSKWRWQAVKQVGLRPSLRTGKLRF